MKTALRCAIRQTRAFSWVAVIATLFLPARVTQAAPEPAFVPWPQQVELADGALTLKPASRVLAAEEQLLPLARILADEIARTTGLKLKAAVDTAKAGDIALTLSPQLKKEHYQFKVADAATVTGGDYNAVAMGTATLLQALSVAENNVTLPHLMIADHPDFEYCGTMFDIARKPYSIGTLKQLVDICRFYKIRYMHLHMTDENACVFPFTAYPNIGTQNAGSSGGPAPTRYTLDEVKELVAYADARGITLVPELEMPGHSGSLIAGLPEVFGAKDDDGKPLNIGMINIGNEKAYEAIDTMIGELCEVFKSSPYIHTGGDEVAMVNLDRCPDIRALAAKHKLNSLYEAINPFQHRVHGMITKRGKQMIAWDGGHSPKPLPKDIIFMPWQHETPEASRLVKEGYRVINAPWGTRKPYMNPYQVNGALLEEGEPLLIGATSILWEAPQEEAVPFLRLRGALRNEPAYNVHAGRGHEDFIRRVTQTDLLLERLLYGFSFVAEGLIDPTVFMQLSTSFSDHARLQLNAPGLAGTVHFTLDDSEPTAESPRLTQPLDVTESCILKARAFNAGGEPLAGVLVRDLRKVPAVPHAAIGAKVTYDPPAPGYLGPGPGGLVDGYLADQDDFSAAGWLGWLHSNVEINLDMGKPIAIHRLGGRFARGRFGLNLPKTVEYLVSEDGQTYKSVGTVDAATAGRQRGWYEVTPQGVTARYILVKTVNGGDWTFVDEIAVNHTPPPPTITHEAMGKPIVVTPAPSPDYSLPGIEGLTDGYLARSTDFSAPYWLGTEGKDVEATIDMSKVTDIRKVGIHTLRYVPAGIHFPRFVQILVSDNGRQFTKVKDLEIPEDKRPGALSRIEADLTDVKARYVRFLVGQQTYWTFLDEIYINPREAGK